MHGAAKGRIWFPTVFVRLNGGFGDTDRGAAIRIPHIRENAASAIAAPAQVIRFSVIQQTRSE